MRTARRVTKGDLLRTLLVISVASFASSIRADDESRWVPGLAFEGGVTFQKVEGDAGSTVRPSADGDDQNVTPFVGLNAEIAAPAWLPGGIRPFLHAGLLVGFPVERGVAREGDPGKIRIPMAVPGVLPEQAVTGVGSETVVESDSLSYEAGAGIILPFDLWERQVHAKPSFEWLHYELEVSGTVNRAINPDGTPPLDELVLLGDRTRRAYDAIGPGFEIELEAGRAGDFAISCFLKGAAYAVLGDREIDLSDTQPAVSPGFPDPHSAVWSFEIDPWIYRASAGVRIQWQPED